MAISTTKRVGGEVGVVLGLGTGLYRASFYILDVRALSRWVVPRRCNNVYMNQSYSPVVHVSDASKAKDSVGTEVSVWIAIRYLASIQLAQGRPCASVFQHGYVKLIDLPTRNTNPESDNAGLFRSRGQAMRSGAPVCLNVSRYAACCPPDVVIGWHFQSVPVSAASGEECWELQSNNIQGAPVWLPYRFPWHSHY